MTTSERIARMFDFFSMTEYLIILGSILVIAIMFFVISEKKRAKTQHERNEIALTLHEHPEESVPLKKAARRETLFTVSSIALFSVIIISVFCVTSFGVTFKAAWDRGLWNSIHVTHVEDELPEDLSQKLIICYRFGCKDCEDTYEALTEALQNTQDVYWIATRSKQGVAFKDKYNVETVPSAIYITKNGEALSFTLYTQRFSHAILDEQTVQDMLTAVQYDRTNN